MWTRSSYNDRVLEIPRVILHPSPSESLWREEGVFVFTSYAKSPFNEYPGDHIPGVFLGKDSNKMEL